MDFNGAGRKAYEVTVTIYNDAWGPELRKQVFYENPTKWIGEMLRKQNPQGDEEKWYNFNISDI